MLELSYVNSKLKQRFLLEFFDKPKDFLAVLNTALRAGLFTNLQVALIFRHPLQLAFVWEKVDDINEPVGEYGPLIELRRQSAIGWHVLNARSHWRLFCVVELWQAIAIIEEEVVFILIVQLCHDFWKASRVANQFACDLLVKTVSFDFHLFLHFLHFFEDFVDISESNLRKVDF